jgi:hypothetical protein
MDGHLVHLADAWVGRAAGRSGDRYAAPCRELGHDCRRSASVDALARQDAREPETFPQQVLQKRVAFLAVADESVLAARLVAGLAWAALVSVAVLVRAEPLDVEPSVRFEPVLREPRVLRLQERQERAPLVLQRAQKWARVQPEEPPEQQASAQLWARARRQREPMPQVPAQQARAV